MLHCRVFVFVLALALVAACKKEAPDSAKATSGEPASATGEAGATAAKGSTPSPITSTFVRLEGEGDAARAVVRFASTADKAVERLMLVVRFLSVDDRELGRRPWTQSGPAVVAPKADAELTLGMALPPGTTKVEALVAEVRFAGGETWRGNDVRVAKPHSGKRPASFRLNNVEHLRPVTRAEASVRTAPRPDLRGGVPGTEPAPAKPAPTPAPFAPTRPPITR